MRNQRNSTNGRTGSISKGEARLDCRPGRIRYDSTEEAPKAAGELQGSEVAGPFSTQDLGDPDEKVNRRPQDSGQQVAPPVGRVQGLTQEA